MSNKLAAALGPQEWRRIRRIVIVAACIMIVSGAIGSCAGAVRDYSGQDLSDPGELQLELHFT